jgi:hypothetical protein
MVPPSSIDTSEKTFDEEVFKLVGAGGSSLQVAISPSTWRTHVCKVAVLSQDRDFAYVGGGRLVPQGDALGYRRFQPTKASWRFFSSVKTAAALYEKMNGKVYALQLLYSLSP